MNKAQRHILQSETLWSSIKAMILISIYQKGWTQNNLVLTG
jgi:hypothetical protein